jgi:hypothetical protein
MSACHPGGSIGARVFGRFNGGRDARAPSSNVTPALRSP